MESGNNKIKNTLFGKEKDKIPNIAFRIMTGVMNVIDFFNNTADKNYKTLGLKKGQIVVDYGCGPARYIENASKSVSSTGKVYAVDIHPLAIENVKSIIKRKQLNNVEAILPEGYTTSIKDDCVDVVYALDMFHMVSSPMELLQEFHRILNDNGIAIIEDGHQKRNITIKKINDSNLFNIVEELDTHVRCKKRNLI